MEIASDQLEAMLKDPIGAAEALEKLTSGGDEGEPAPDGTKEGEIAAASPAAEPNGDKGPADTPKTEGEPTKASPAEKATDENSVVMTKDGKHQIPYAVLKTERERNEQLQRLLSDANEKIVSLQQAVDTGGKTQDETPAVERLTDEQLDDLESASPTLAKAFRSMYGQIDTLQKRADDAINRLAAETSSRAKSAVDEAIDAVPKLAYVRSADSAIYNEIAAIDMLFRQQGKFMDLPLHERFGKAVAMYEAANGQIKLPGAGSDSGGGLDPAKAAAEAIRKAEDAAHPQTLTDLPGGAPPPRDELEGLSEKSAVSLTSMFMKMTPDQLDTFLSRI